MAAGAALIAPRPAGAQTVVDWNGAAGGNWSTASDWSPAGVPNLATDDVTIGNHSGTVLLDIDALIGQLALTSGNTLGFKAGETLTVQSTPASSVGVTINSGATVNLILGGSSALTANGALDNAGALNVGATSVASPASVTAGALDNTGTITIVGVGSGVSGAGLQTSFTVTGSAFSSGVPTTAFPVVNASTLSATLGAVLSFNGAFGNLGTTNIDTSGAGGSSLTVAGAISNAGTSLNVGPYAYTLNTTGGTLDFGNAGILHGTTITAAGLNNFGSLTLVGSPTVQTLLDLTGAASTNPLLQPPGILSGGSYTLTSDAVLQYAGPGINGIASGVAVTLSGAGASFTATGLVANTASGTNSGFNTLGGSGGTFNLNNGASVATGAAVDFVNQGTLAVDSTSAGGSSLTIGGTLQNATGATLTLGNSSITRPTTVTAAGLVNDGSLTLTGSPTTSALLTLTGPAASNPFIGVAGVLGSGSYTLTNDAVLAFAGPGISAITEMTTVNLNGAGASFNATGLTPNTASGTNSAFDTLASNTGTLALTNGATVATNAGLGLLNAGALNVDPSGAGGSRLTVGGGLTNGYGGTITIGNANLTAATVVTVTGPLTSLGGSNIGNAGSIPTTNAIVNLTGSPTVSSTLNVTGAAPTTLIGNFTLTNDALLEFGGGGITAIAGNSAGSLYLNGAGARVALAGATATSSALTGLASNGGTLTLINGAKVATGVNLVNSGIIGLDAGGTGGSTLAIGGMLQNTENAQLAVGSGSLSANSSASAAGFYQNMLLGTVAVTGDGPGFGTSSAALILTNGITSIGRSASLSLANGSSFVSLAGSATLSNNALATLTTIDGMLNLSAGAQVSTAPGLALTNDSGSITLLPAGATSGTTSLSVGGLLTNDLGSIEIDNQSSQGVTSLAVSAAGVVNNGTIDLQGYDANHTATLTVNGSVTNTGAVNIGAPISNPGYNAAALTVVGGTYTQLAGGTGAGTTSVQGTLTASSVTVSSGTLQGTGTVNGNVLDQDGAVTGGAIGTPGALAIHGNYTQGAAGVTYEALDGISNGQFSSLNVNGNVHLGGLLDITTGYTLTLAAGQTFDILNVTSTTGSITGTFSGLEYNGQVASGSVLNLGGGLGLELTYNGNDVQLGVVPYTPAASVASWSGGSGTWSTANGAAWSTGANPSTTSDAIVGGSTGGTVTLDPSVAGATVNSLAVTNGYTLAYGAANESLTLKADANVSAGGTLTLANAGDGLTTGAGGQSGNFNNFGTVSLANGAGLAVGAGGVFRNAGTLNVQNGATLTVAGDFLNGTPGSGSPSSTATFAASGLSSVGGNFVNNAEAGLSLDPYTANSAGGSTLTVAGTLTNAGSIVVGSEITSAPVTLNVATLSNTGSIQIEGGSTQFYQPANVLSMLNVSGAWLPASGALATGYYDLVGDAVLQWTGPGITSLGAAVVVTLDGVNASLTSTSLAPNTSSGLNSGLNTLTRIATGSSLVVQDGAQVQTNAGLALTNNGGLTIDSSNTGTLGGSSVVIGGVLNNYGVTSLGSTNNPTPSTLTAAGLFNAGAVVIEGSANATGPATFTVNGPAGSFVPASGLLAQGSYTLFGNAVLQYAGPGITALGAGVTLVLESPNASINATSVTPIASTGTNSALNSLAANAGTLTISDGAQIATNPGLNLTNTGSIAFGGEGYDTGTSTLTVGGTLINTGSINVASGSSTPASLLASGLVNSGTIEVSGSQSAPASVAITGVAASNPFVSATGVLSPGYYELGQYATFEFTGPGISAISAGATVSILGSTSGFTSAGVAGITANGTNSAFNGLATNAGHLLLDGALITTRGDLLNSGDIVLAYGPAGSPTASLAVGGTLTNTSTYPQIYGQDCGVCVASGGLLTANGLVNSGNLSVSGVAQSYSSVATANVNGTAANSGTLTVDAGAQFTATGAFTNAGTGVLSIAPNPNFSTTTNVSTGAFTNLGTVTIGNAYQSPVSQGVLTVAGAGYTQSGPLATTTIVGTLVAPSVTLNGGLLQGSGTITGNLVNGATVIANANPEGIYGPVNPALLTVNGNYTQNSGGVLDELIQAPPVTRGTSYGAINVSGSAQLGGALDVTTLSSYAFAAGQSYDILNFRPGTLAGSFSALEYDNVAVSGNGTTPLNIGNGLALDVAYENSSGEVLLQVVSAQGPPAIVNWIGGTDVWSNGVNWSSGTTPTSAQSVVVGTGTSGGTVTYDVVSATIDNLTVSYNDGASYTLAFGAGNALAVTGSVTNSGEIDLLAAGSSLTSAGSYTNGVVINEFGQAAGVTRVANGATLTVGSVAAPAGLVNLGTLFVDTSYGDLNLPTGGSRVLVSGSLTSSGGIEIGYYGLSTANPGITSESLVSAASLGTISNSSTLANTLGGAVTITGENPTGGTAPAVLQLGTSITAIAPGGALTLANGNSFVTTDTTGPLTNDGLSALTSNAGTLTLGAGANATLAGTLTNASSGSLALSTFYYVVAPPEGEATPTDIATTLKVGGLVNDGQITLTGCQTAGCTAAALLAVTGPSGSFAPGGNLQGGPAFYSLSGDAVLQYTGPGVSAIGSGVYVSLSGGAASFNATGLTPNNGATNSGFDTLAINEGTLNLSSGASIVTNPGLALNNYGTIGVSEATLTIGGMLANYGGSLTTGAIGLGVGGGAVSAASLGNYGVLETDSGTAPGTLAVTGVAANSGLIAVVGNTALTVGGLLTNNAGASLQVGGVYLDGGFSGPTGAGTLSAAGVANSGTVDVWALPGQAATLTVTGAGNAYTQSGFAATSLVEGTLTAPAIAINGGVLEGNGLVVGAVTNAASVAPGTSATTPALLTINGSYAQTSAGSLAVTLQGTTNRGTDYSALNVGGPVSLAGGLTLTTATTSLFAANQSYDLINLTANQLSGTFDTLSYGTVSTSGTGVLAIPSSNLALAIEYDGSNGEVLLDVVTPNDWRNGTGLWSDPDNWSGGAPNHTQLVVIGTGGGGTVTLDENASVYNLTVEPGTSSGYTLLMSRGQTLQTAGTVTVGAGAAIELAAPLARLAAGGDLTNAGSLDLENGGSVAVGTSGETRNLNNSGTIVIDGGVTGGSLLAVSGTVNNAGGTITVGNTGIGAPSSLTAAAFAGNALTGTVTLAGNPTATLDASATLQLQNGLTSIAAGGSLTLANGQSFVSLAGGSGNGGLGSLSTIAGGLALESGSVVTTSGALTIAANGRLGVDDAIGNTGGSSLTVGGALSNAGNFQLGTGSFSAILPTQATATTLDNSGTLGIGGSTLDAGATLTVNGAAGNSGAVSVAGHGLLLVSGTNGYAQSTATASTTIATGAVLTAATYVQSGGTTTVGTGGLLGASLNAASGVTITGGTLQGTGTVSAGNVANLGGLLQGSPDGATPGTLTINGNYTQGTGGTLGELIAGTPASGLYGVLNVRGAGSTVSLGGALDISALNSGNSLAVGQSFDILNFAANGLSGSFGTLEYGACPGPSCITSTGTTPLVVNLNGSSVAFLVNYEQAAGEVLLEVETPPPPTASWSSGSGTWSSTGAWSDGILPLSFQAITIGTGAGGTVTYDQTTATVSSLAVGTGSSPSAGYILTFAPSKALAVTGGLSVNPGGELDVAAEGATLATGGNVSNGGILSVANGGTLTVGTAANPATLLNLQTLDVDAGGARGGGSLVVSGTLTNEGFFAIGNAALTAATQVSAGGLANSAGVVLAGGSVSNAATLTVNGNAVNTGAVNVGAFSGLNVVGAGNGYTQNTGVLTTTILTGTLTAPTVTLNGGGFEGNGVVNGNLVNSGGLVSPTTYASGAPGVLTVNGSYAQTAGGTLETLLSGSGAAGIGYGALAVNGAVSLGGTLQVAVASGFAFAPGQSFEILNFTPNQLTGAFASLAYGGASAGATGVLAIGNNLDLGLAYEDAAGAVLLEVGALDSWLGGSDLWTGPHDASNWSTDPPPTPNEDVLIGTGPGGTVTYNEASSTVRSLTVQAGTSSGYTLAFAADDILQVTNGVSINVGGTIEVAATGAALESGGPLANAGTLILANGGVVSVGTAGTPANLTNAGTIRVDGPGGPTATGGSVLTIAGSLNDSGGVLVIGNGAITTNAVVSASSLIATTGANTLDGTVTLTGQNPGAGSAAALLELGSALTSIAATGSLTLANSNAYVTLESTGPFSNDALGALATNAGTLSLNDGATVTTHGNLVNSGLLSVDGGSSAGGSTLSIGGTIDNGAGTMPGHLDIGNAGMTAAATVEAAGFPANTLNGDVSLTSGAGGAAAGAAATLELADGVVAIGADAVLGLTGANAWVNVQGAAGHNSALAGLSSIAGTLALNDGAAVTTSGALAVSSTGGILLDANLFGGSTGGSSLSVGGALTNAGMLYAGLDASATAATSLAATGFSNSGSATLGGSPGGAIFTVRGAASNSGSVTLLSGGQIVLTAGNGYTQAGGAASTTSIAQGAALTASSFTQSGGTTTVNGSLNAPNGVTLSGGTLQGAGAIGGALANAGGVLLASADGQNPATLTLNGSYAQSAGATLSDIINGGVPPPAGTLTTNNAGQYSLLKVTGAASTVTLGGTLAISTPAGFSFGTAFGDSADPQLQTQTWDIIDLPANALSGSFSSISYDGVTASGTGVIDFTAQTSGGPQYLSLGVHYLDPQGVVQLVLSQQQSDDIWNGPSGNWTSQYDQTNWSTSSAPTNQQNAAVGGGNGGTVTLNTNAAVFNLTVEAANQNDATTNYTLGIGGGYTLAASGSVKIDQGGEIDVTGAGSTLTSAGSASNGGILSLSGGGTVTIGTSSVPANFVNYTGPSPTMGTVGPTNPGTINVDTSGPGGSTLTINGTLENRNETDGVVGTINIGNADLSANATLSAQDFSTSGSLQGVIKITGPTGAAGAGVGQAALILGTAVTTIPGAGSLTLIGDNAFVALAGMPGSNSALTTLASNAGTLDVVDVSVATGGVTTNGDSHGLFTNTGTIELYGSTFAYAAYNLTVAGAGGMLNSGTIVIGGVNLGSGSNNLTGTPGDGSLRVSNGEFVQGSGGTTTVGGTAGNESRLQADAENITGTVGLDNQAGGTLNILAEGVVCVGDAACGGSGNDRDLTNEGMISVTGTLTVSGNVSNAGTGVLSVDEGGFVGVTHNLTNNGSINIDGTLASSGDIQNSGQFAVSGTVDPVHYIQTAGSTVVNGTLVGTSAIEILGGTLAGGTNGGTGTLLGNTTVNGAAVTVGAAVAAAGAPTLGALHVEGSYTQSGGSLGFFVASNGAGGFVNSNLLVDPGNPVSIEDTSIVFTFGAGADPAQYLAAGDFNLEAFFQDSDGSAFGATFGFAEVFQDDTFGYETPGGALVDLNFDPATGALSLAANGVPEPATGLLVLPGLAALGLVFARRRPSPRTRRAA